MLEFNVKNTVKYLTLLELPDDREITEADIKTNFRQLCKIFHPDQSIDRYKDGSRFLQIKEGREYLSYNISKVNEQIRNRFSPTCSQNSYYDAQRQAEEQRRSEERRKADEQRRSEERRRAEEQRKAEQKRKIEEQFF